MSECSACEGLGMIDEYRCETCKGKGRIPDVGFPAHNAPDPTPAPRSGRERPHYKDRAGTPLDHRFTEVVYTNLRGKKTQAGHIDTRARIFQYGSTLSKLVYWKQRAMSITLDVWQAIQGRVEWLELIDNDTNTCYTIPISEAIARGHQTTTEWGERWMIPLGEWKRYDRAGEEIVPVPASPRGPD